MPRASAVRKKGEKGAKKAVAKGRAGGKGSRAISDASVERATGKATDHWFKVLDAFAKKSGGHRHKAAAEHLHAAHGVAEWWSQMVTVLYERERGHREKHQVAGGYSASASRTVGVAIGTLYAAWSGELRARWLDEELTVRKATVNRSVRITWGDGTSVEVMFYPKGSSKSMVTVQHGKLKNAAAVGKVKRFWGGRLDALRAVLEG
jgi:hypothetical protein